MKFSTSTKGKYTIIHISTLRLDASLTEDFNNYMLEEIEKGATHIIIDLSKVKFMDSSGLGCLVFGYKKLLGPGQFTVASPRPALIDLFELTSIDKLIKIVDSIDAAIEE